MKVDGGYLTLLMGKTLPRPASAELMRSLAEATVTVSEGSASGFQITFRAGRSGPQAIKDYPLQESSQLKPFHRVVLLFTMKSISYVLMDGIIVDVQHNPGAQPGDGIITVTGEDLTVLMDLEEKQAEHPAQNAIMQVTKTLARYLKYGIAPQLIPPPTLEVPSPLQQIPVQRETDLELIQRLAKRYGYVFFIKPGPLPGANRAYWGPPPRLGVPQKALTMNMGTATNVDSLSFRFDALSSSLVEGCIQDPKTGVLHEVKSSNGKHVPLSTKSAMKLARQHKRIKLLTASGLSQSQAKAMAQAAADESTLQVVRGTGSLNTLVYGGVLEARRLVGVRGVGYTYDGLYLVTKVSHAIRPGSYVQSFELAREGTGSTVPLVRV